MKSRKRSQAGFTLIELALIIAVLGILGAVGAVKFASLTDEAAKAQQSTVLANARSALAIAIAKDSDPANATPGKVTAAELKTYLEGFDDSSLKIEGYTLTFNTGYANDGITSVVSAAK